MTESERIEQGLEAYRGLLDRYRDTLNIVSSRHEHIVADKIAEARLYANALDLNLHASARVVDLGSGAGLPGVVIALMRPKLDMYLIERRRRRVAFLRTAVAHLALDNATVVEGDAIEQDLDPCHAIVAQAVGSFSEIYCHTRRFHAPEIVLLSRKGPTWPREAEMLEQRTGTAIEQVTDQVLEGRGRLVGLRLAGGRACRSSG